MVEMNINQNLKEIDGIFDIELGKELDITDKRYVKQSMLSYELREAPERYKYFKQCIININPLNNRVFKIYSVFKLTYNTPRTELRAIYNEIKHTLITNYGQELVVISGVDGLVLSLHDKAITLSIDEQKNIITLDSTDNIILQNCYSLFAY